LQKGFDKKSFTKSGTYPGNIRNALIKEPHKELDMGGTSETLCEAEEYRIDVGEIFVKCFCEVLIKLERGCSV